MGALVVNAEYPLSDNTTLYAFGDVNIRKGTSFCFIQSTLLVSDPNNLLHDAGTTYNGFQPTFHNTDVFDNLGSIGIKIYCVWF
jgi:iron complex outermembrane receptor protein